MSISKLNEGPTYLIVNINYLYSKWVATTLGLHNKYSCRFNVRRCYEYASCKTRTHNQLLTKQLHYHCAKLALLKMADRVRFELTVQY